MYQSREQLRTSGRIRWTLSIKADGQGSAGILTHMNWLSADQPCAARAAASDKTWPVAVIHFEREMQSGGRPFPYSLCAFKVQMCATIDGSVREWAHRRG
jgi:hypothetical protein